MSLISIGKQAMETSIVIEAFGKSDLLRSEPVESNEVRGCGDFLEDASILVS